MGRLVYAFVAGILRHENLSLFRGFPLFGLKIVETKSVCQTSISKFDVFLKRGKGVSSLCIDFLFFEETLFSSLHTTKYPYFHSMKLQYLQKRI